MNTSQNKILYVEELKPVAQQLRRNQTPEERRLWYDYLSVYPVRFRRQKQFDIYIVDFYCAKAKIVVELDGAQHYTDKGRCWDHARYVHLESLGLKVLRFENRMVRDRFREVCEQIDHAVKERMIKYD